MTNLSNPLNVLELLDTISELRKEIAAYRREDKKLRGDLLTLRAENEKLLSIYIIDEEGREYVQVCMLKEKINEMRRDHTDIEVWGIENLKLAEERGREVGRLREACEQIASIILEILKN